MTLDRPDRLNPISARDGGTRDQILWALGDAEADEAIGCVLIRGAGRAFSAGGDLAGNAPRETPFEHNQFLERVERFHDRIRGATLPVVAAVHGYCLGTAMQLVAACDFVVAADTARLGFPEGRMGLDGVSPLVTTVGRQWAKFLITTGELIDAHQARSIGLVLSVEPEEELLGRARDLCQRIARLPREAVRTEQENGRCSRRCVGGRGRTARRPPPRCPHSGSQRSRNCSRWSKLRGHSPDRGSRGHQASTRGPVLLRMAAMN